MAAADIPLAPREGADIILTPHPGEMAALASATIEEVQGSRLATARDFAIAHRSHVVLKGHRTIVATPDGAAFINLTGNAGMATAGTGDVLTGVVASFLAKGLAAQDAAAAGAVAHGLAARLVEHRSGLVASDLLHTLPVALDG